ncbi:MAG: hypothetical protein HY880_04140 [Deltaproteobacteria bacterium]|nr:hypothetical protein [Deltaproteobacteria bacterium]
MNLCRVYYQTDGQVSVVYPAPKEKRDGETGEAFLERVCQRLDTNLNTLPFDDMDASILPSRTDREKWRGSKGQGIKVDTTIITKAERRKAVETSLDAELAKPNGNPITAMRLQRQLEKGDY